MTTITLSGNPTKTEKSLYLELQRVQRHEMAQERQLVEMEGLVHQLRSRNQALSHKMDRALSENEKLRQENDELRKMLGGRENKKTFQDLMLSSWVENRRVNGLQDSFSSEKREKHITRQNERKAQSLNLWNKSVAKPAIKEEFNDASRLAQMLSEEIAREEQSRADDSDDDASSLSLSLQLSRLHNESPIRPIDPEETLRDKLNTSQEKESNHHKQQNNQKEVRNEFKKSQSDAIIEEEHLFQEEQKSEEDERTQITSWSWSRAGDADFHKHNTADEKRSNDRTRLVDHLVPVNIRQSRFGRALAARCTTQKRERPSISTKQSERSATSTQQSSRQRERRTSKDKNEDCSTIPTALPEQTNNQRRMAPRAA